MLNNSQIAFSPQGNTIVVPADAVASTGLQAPVFGSLAAQAVGQYRITNASTTITVFLGVNSSAAGAEAKAVIPVAGTPSPAIVLLPGQTQILRFGPEVFFSGIASGPATVYITPGQGL